MGRCYRWVLHRAQRVLHQAGCRLQQICVLCAQVQENSRPVFDLVLAVFPRELRLLYRVSQTITLSARSRFFFRPSARQGKGIEPDIRGGLPLKMVSTELDFDQNQFDAAREKMKACPAMGSTRVGFKGAAGASNL